MRAEPLIALAALALASPGLAENYDVSFKGGTAKEYYNALQKTMPGIRLVVHPDVDYFMMPPVELPDVNEWAAISLPGKLNQAIRPDFIVDGDAQTLDGATFVVGVDPGYLERELALPATFDLDFGGGSFGSFVERLREVADANIVLDPAAAGVPVPPMRLRSANVHNVMVTIEGYQPDGFDGDARVKVDWIKAGDTRNYLYMISLQSSEDRVHRNRVVRYWSLGNVLSGTSLAAEDVLGAVETTRPFLFEDFDISYHEPTQVLIVKGAQSDLASIDNLLERVEESAHSMGR